MAKRIVSTRLWRQLLLAGLLLFQTPGAFAGDVGITYVKTIGQVWPELAMVTGGGRLSVDEKGNLYTGTPGQNSFLQKISPEGRVIWRADDTHNAYYGTAVDDKYVYGSGIGYYGYGHLLRRKKESGVVPLGWKFVWTKPTDVINGVRAFTYPGPLLVDEAHLYILDIGNGELRRLNKETGEEKPFANPIKIEGAFDMAFAKANAILVLANPKDAAPPGATHPLTTSFVAEIERATGKLLREKMIAGLLRSVAIAVHPKTGDIFIGEGGSPTHPINKVRIFAADGTDTGKTIGRGGEWQGPWARDAFAFSSGAADIAFDASGGLWSNTYGSRMRALGLLVHFSPAYQPGKVFMAATGDGVAVDGDLNVAVGGNYKLSWSGDLLWTSGLVATGKPNQFPTTIDYWTVRPAYADAQQTIFVNVHGPTIFALDAKTGENTGKGFAVPVPGITAVANVGQNIYILGGGKVLRTTAELTPLQEHFTVPEDVTKKNLTGLALSEDQSTLFISTGNGADARVYAYKNGQVLWEAKAGAVLARYKNILLTANPNGPGMLALDADDGGLSTIIGNRAIEDRPPLSGITGVAVGSKDGVDYLVVACQYRILVYRIVAAE